MPMVTIGSGEAEAPAVTETTATPTLQELVTAYSAERAAILETAENRHALEWGNAALKDQQVWQYIQHSGGNPDLEGLAMLMDAALAEYRTPTQSAKMDYAKRSANQIFLGSYTDDVTPAGTVGQMALGFTGADIFMDARDLSYDLTHLRTIPPGQLGLDALALLPVVGGLKYADEAAALIKNGQRAVEAAGDMAKHGDDLVDAGGELVYNGAKQLDNVELTEGERIVQKIGSLPQNSRELLSQGWTDITPPKMSENTTYKLFEDSETGLIIRFDEGREGAFGFAGQDHYHIYNPNSTGKGDCYLDINGNPVAKNSRASHIIPMEVEK